MANYLIDWVNKADTLSPNEHITHVGGPKPDDSGQWKDTAPNVGKFIEGKQHRFYTKVVISSAWVGCANLLDEVFQCHRC
jgi:hypothetical protein